MICDPAVMPADQVVAAIATPLVGLADLEMLLKRLLPSVLAPPILPVPSEIETVLARLLSSTPALVPASPSRSTTTDIETMLHWCVFPVANRATEWAGARSWMKHSLICCRDGRRRRWTGNLQPGNDDWSGVGGQPPGSGAPDEHTYPPLSREPVEQLVFPSTRRRLTYRTDEHRGDAVKTSADPGTGGRGCAHWCRRRYETHRKHATFTSTEDIVRRVIYEWSEVDAVGVTSSADFAGDVTVWVSSRPNLLETSSSVCRPRPTSLEMSPSVWRPRPTLLDSSPSVWCPRPTWVWWRLRRDLFPLRGSCYCQLVPAYYGLSLGVGAVMAVPCRVVLGMEGDRPGMYGPPACPTQRRYIGKNQDTWPVLPSLDGDTCSMEHGVACWRVRHRHGRHAIPSARWPVGTPVSSLHGPSPSRASAGTGYEEPISFHHPGFGGGPVDHFKASDSSFCRGGFQSWTDGTITHRILHPRRGRLSVLQPLSGSLPMSGLLHLHRAGLLRIEEPASPDLLQPSRGGSLLLPITTCPTLNRLRFRSRCRLMFFSQWMVRFRCLRRQFLVFRYRRASLRSARCRSVRRRLLPIYYRRFRCSPRDRCWWVGFSRSLMNTVRSAAPRHLLLPYLASVHARCRNQSGLTGLSIVPPVARQARRLPWIPRLSSLLCSFTLSWRTFCCGDSPPSDRG